MAGSAWLNLVSQHRQQTQALSPHQARAQFLGKSPGLGERVMGGLLRRGSWTVDMEAPFSLYKGIFGASQAELPQENTLLKFSPWHHLGYGWPWAERAGNWGELLGVGGEEGGETGG